MFDESTDAYMSDWMGECSIRKSRHKIKSHRSYFPNRTLIKVSYPYHFYHGEVRSTSLSLEIKKTFVIILTERVCQKWRYVTFKSRNTCSWSLQLPCKESDCPKVAKPRGSPNLALERPHGEAGRVHEGREMPSQLTAAQALFTIHYQQPHGRPHVRLLSQSFPNSWPTETSRDNKMIAVALNH